MNNNRYLFLKFLGTLMRQTAVHFYIFLTLIFSSQQTFAQNAEKAPQFDFENLELVYPENYEKSPAMNSQDPYEGFNRQMLSFNLAFHNTVGKPIVKGYRLIPKPIRTGTENFLNNLGQPLSMINSFLQGNVEDGLHSFMRFTINSTFGILGLLDIASEAGLHDKKEDFGQTLYVWGVWPEASFVVLPLLGPTTTRDIFGKVEGAIDPIYESNELSKVYGFNESDGMRSSVFTANGITAYNRAAPLINVMENQIDPYLFMREGYLQNRINAIYNGKPPLPKLEDDFLFE